MMSWLWGAALVPLLLCGLMCVGGMLLAALGLRHATQRGQNGHAVGIDDRLAPRSGRPGVIDDEELSRGIPDRAKGALPS